MSKGRRRMADRRPGFDVAHSAANHRAMQWVRDALDPTKAPSKPKAFSQMSDAEREEMRKLYERKP
jgi:hypothetical protein